MYDASRSDSCMITVIATGLEDMGTAATQSRMTQTTVPQFRGALGVQNTLQGMNQPTRQPAQPIYTQGGYSQNYSQPTYQQPAQSGYAQVNYGQPTQKPVTPSRPLTGINRPSDIRSSVEEKSLKIPDFLQRK